MMPRSQYKTWWIDLFWLTLLISAVFWLFLGTPALTPPDEARYAEIPREMLATHEWMIPHLNGLMYFEKPPLSYWIVAFFEKCFGLSEWAVRSPNEIYSLMQKGALSRATATTKMNDLSSRSHAVFIIIVEQMTTLDDGTQIIT